MKEKTEVMTDYDDRHETEGQEIEFDFTNWGDVLSMAAFVGLFIGN